MTQLTQGSDMELEVGECYGPTLDVRISDHLYVQITKDNIEKVASWMGLPEVSENGDGTFRFSTIDGSHTYNTMKIGDYVVDRRQVLEPFAFRSIYMQQLSPTATEDKEVK